MKFILLILIAAFAFQNFACFTGKTDNNEKTSAGDNNSSQTKNSETTSTKIEKQVSKLNMDSIPVKFSDLNKDAFNLHYDAIVVDTHNDILMPIFLQGADINRNNANTQSDFVKWKKGGLDVQVFSIYVPDRYKSNHFNYVMKLIDEMNSYASVYSETFALCRNYAELEAGLNAGKMCGLMGGEGGQMVEGSMDNLETLHSRGLRYLGLTWNTSNAIGTSARDENDRGKAGGLTDFGKDVVKRMNELGMLVDVSHLGETAFWDVVAITNSPIIASHSNVYNLAPHYRNLTDEQIKSIAKSGGYIGMNFYNKFLDPSANVSQIKSIQNKYKQGSKEFEDDNDLPGFNDKRYEFITNNRSEGGTSVDVLIDHIDYIVKLVGVDYVGLGSDFDGSITTLNEMYDATCYPILTKRLVERGYSEQDIRKILGLNFIRVFKQVCK